MGCLAFSGTPTPYLPSREHQGGREEGEEEEEEEEEMEEEAERL